MTKGVWYVRVTPTRLVHEQNGLVGKAEHKDRFTVVVFPHHGRVQIVLGGSSIRSMGAVHFGCGSIFSFQQPAASQ